jgi:Zn ribbon nucleic-acid-binding protein
MLVWNGLKGDKIMVECPYCGYIHKPKNADLFSDKPIEWIGEESFENIGYEAETIGFIIGKQCPKCKKIFINARSGDKEVIFLRKET